MSPPVIIGIIAAVVALAVMALAAMYNRLVGLRQRTLNAYSQIDVQLKRRHDLIPNLVETVKGYMAHERQTLEAVTQARNVAVNASALAANNPRDAGAVAGAATAESALLAALGRLVAIAENYPQLKADQTASRLMEELSSTENRVAFARQAYNDSVMRYNTSVQSFPPNVFAGMFGFQQASLFQIDSPTERAAVGVSFDANRTA